MNKHEVLLWSGFATLVTADLLHDGLVAALATSGVLLLLAGLGAWVKRG